MFFIHHLKPIRLSILPPSIPIRNLVGSSLFQCAVDDNIFKREDLLALHSWGLDISVPILAKASQFYSYCTALYSTLLNSTYSIPLCSFVLYPLPSLHPSPSLASAMLCYALLQVANRYARNLISMLLSKDPSRRPSPSRVLDHPFLSNKRYSVPHSLLRISYLRFLSLCDISLHFSAPLYVSTSL